MLFPLNTVPSPFSLQFARFKCQWFCRGVQVFYSIGNDNAAVKTFISPRSTTALIGSCKVLTLWGQVSAGNVCMCMCMCVHVCVRACVCGIFPLLFFSLLFSLSWGGSGHARAVPKTLVTFTVARKFDEDSWTGFLILSLLHRPHFPHSLRVGYPWNVPH